MREVCKLKKLRKREKSSEEHSLSKTLTEKKWEMEMFLKYSSWINPDKD